MANSLTGKIPLKKIYFWISKARGKEVNLRCPSLFENVIGLCRQSWLLNVTGYLKSSIFVETTFHIISKKKVIKQTTNKLVYHKLLGALAELRIGTDDKKFTKKLKEASRLLSEDIAAVLIKTIPEKVKIKKEKGKGSKEDNKKAKLDALDSVKIKKIKKQKTNTVTEPPQPPTQGI